MESTKSVGPCPFEPLYPSALVRDAAHYMALAYNQARLAWDAGEVPVGAVIVANGSVLAAAHNAVETLQDPTAHAEMLALTQAAKALGTWRLNAATLYVTKEPCPMCAGAAVMSRLGKVVFGTPDPKMGFMGGACALHQHDGLNHSVAVEHGPLAEACTTLLQAFFQKRRQSGL